MNWKFLNSGLNSGSFNMDFDLFLTENIEPDNVYLRLYQWHPYCISLGVNQSEDEIDLKKAKYNMVDVVQRPTEGSAFIHAMELAFSVIYTICNSISKKNFVDEINTALRKGLILFDSKLSAIEIRSNISNSDEFHNDKIGNEFSTKSEIYLNDKKLVRSTRRRFNNVVLQQGSILCGNYYQNIIEYLKINDDQKKEISNEIGATTDLQRELKKDIDYNRLSMSVKKGFEKHFDCKFEETEQTELEISFIS
ncbi:MAG: hypothetical protein ROY99_06620 [Ignavibacterium sp.]|jgi:lipoate-protein ligase A|nr:hypothetical protein [Ignavibacterium sp.]